MTTPDLRAIVRARMLALGIDQATLARRMAPRWGYALPAQAVERLSRWFAGARDMPTDAFAELLAELGGSLAWDAAPSVPSPPADAPARRRRASKRPRA